MAKRVRLNAADYYDDYGDDAADDDYYGEQDDEAQAIKESKAAYKKQQKAAKKAKGVQDSDIDAVLALFPGNEFTREQIRGTLEHYKNDKDQAIKQLKFKKEEREKKGKENVKARLQEEAKQARASAAVEEEKKSAQPDKYEQKRQKQMARRLNEPEMVIEQVDRDALNAPYPDVEYRLNGELIEASETDKQNLNLVIIGHVDSGKSTLSGQILHNLGHVSNQQVRANERKAETNNKTGFHLAYIMDETEEEQERGVTIELTTRHFSTPNRNFTLLDAPGHRDFIANMITGASQANVSILCIDLQPAQFERGWEVDGGTTREHALLARSLGVTQLIVAMNKMEKVDFSQDRFEQVKSQVEPYLLSIGFKQADLHFLPISAISNQNVMTKATDDRITSWYGPDGECLIDLLDKLRLPQRSYTRPLRVTVSDYMQKAQGPLIGDCVAAKVECGVLIEKKELLLMPHNILVGIKGVTIAQEPVLYAMGGAIVEVGLRLPSDFDVNFMKRGNVLCDPEYPIKLVSTLIARVVVYELGDRGAICRGEPVVVHSYSTKGPGKLQKFISVIDQATGEVVKHSPKFLRKGMFVNVQIKLQERHCLELFSNMKNVGRIVIRQGIWSIAAGTITEFVS